MTNVSRSRSPALLLLLATTALAACSLQRMAEIVPADLGPPPTAAGPIVGDAPIPSAMGDRLAAAGLDLAKLPALDEIGDDQIVDVMKIFTASLGATCKDCHTADKKEDTPNKLIAQKMWSEFAQKLTLVDGQPVFCDSCHKGKLQFLDRSDEKQLGGWMKTNFVGGLVRKDGQKHTCGTCHGTPFVPGFLDDWGGTAMDEDGGMLVDVDLAEPKPADMGTTAAPDLALPPPSCKLVLNELQVAGSASATDEFIEIYNPCTSAIALADHALVYRSAAGSSDTLLFRFVAQSVSAGGYIVAGNAGFSGAKNVSYTSGLAGAGGGVALRDATGAIVDTIAYGTATNAFVQGSPAKAPPGGKAVARTPNGAHLHADQSLDLVVAIPTPGSAN